MGKIFKLWSDREKEKKLGGLVHGYTTEGGNFQIKVEDKTFHSSFEGYLIHLSWPEAKKLHRQLSQYLDENSDEVVDHETI